MARIVYTVFFYLITPIILLRLLYRSFKSPAYRQRIEERFGFFDERSEHKEKGCIWIHSVSVGETIAAAPVVKRLQLQYPDVPVMVTTMTPTGSERVKALFGESVFHVYAPYDLPGSIQRFLQRTKPQVLVIMETELWPNTIHYCHQQFIPVVVVNARLSAKSAQGYQRVAALARSMFASVTEVVAQTEQDAQRFVDLGMAQEKVVVSGSIKFDVGVDEQLQNQAALLKADWSQQGQRLVWVVASTHDGEDHLILQAFKQVLKQHPDMLLVLVPRHPERFAQVATLVERESLSVQCRSSAEAVERQTQVLVGDTMGELMLFYGCADIVFVGGSFVDTGGHNTLEPAVWGLPIITGDSDFNFLDISRQLQQCGGLKKVNDVEALTQTLLTLAGSKQQRTTMGSAAQQVIGQNRGALDRLLDQIDQYIKS